MSADLIRPPPQVPPATALRISQQGPRVLQVSPETGFPYPLSVIASNETQETWMTYENLLLSCLRTGDDKSALIFIERLAKRFGDTDPKIMAWKGLYEEATAPDDKSLEKVLQQYDTALKDDPTNMPVRKRRIALLKSMSRTSDAIAALVELLDASPTDAEAWSELAELYFAQGSYAQAIYSLEEVLLITPNAWSVQARMAEMLYISATASASSNSANSLRNLSESMRRYCRSIELCDGYLRGYYGLKLTAKHMLEVLPQSSKSSDQSNGDLAPPSKATVEKLNELATSKLAEIVRRASKGDAGWDAYDQAEVIAARELLDRDVKPIER